MKLGLNQATLHQLHPNPPTVGLGQAKSGQARSCQAKPSQAMAGQAKPGQAKPGQVVRSCPGRRKCRGRPPHLSTADLPSNINSGRVCPGLRQAPTPPTTPTTSNLHPNPPTNTKCQGRPHMFPLKRPASVYIFFFCSRDTILSRQTPSHPVP